MGAKESKLKQEMLVKYESETFLTKDEINSAYLVFTSCFPDGKMPSIESRVSMHDLMEKLPFLKFNPFRDRIFAIFSTYPATALSPMSLPPPQQQPSSFGNNSGEGDFVSLSNVPSLEQQQQQRYHEMINNNSNNYNNVNIQTAPTVYQNHHRLLAPISSVQQAEFQPSPPPPPPPSINARQMAPASLSSVSSWCLDDFMHFLSAFNEKAPLALKHEVAFCLYDSDGDGFIGEHDLLNLVKRLVGDFSNDGSVHASHSGTDGAHRYDVQSAERLNDDDYKQIVDQVFNEADLDRDRKMAVKDFTNTMAKFPDFARHFSVPSLKNHIHF